MRIASIIVRYGGEHPGFVLAGRSLREVEKREDFLMAGSTITWARAILTILAVTWISFWFL